MGQVKTGVSTHTDGCGMNKPTPSGRWECSCGKRYEDRQDFIECEESHNET